MKPKNCEWGISYCGITICRMYAMPCTKVSNKNCPESDENKTALADLFIEIFKGDDK